MAIRNPEPALVNDAAELQAVHEAEGASAVVGNSGAGRARFARPDVATPGQVVVVGGDVGRSPIAGRRVWDSIWRSRWVVVVGPILFVVAWQLVITLGHVSPQSLSSPWTVVKTTRTLIDDGTLGPALVASLRRVVIGCAIGITLGSVLAIIAGLTRPAERLVDPLMQMFRTLPPLALVPMFILWFGIGEEPKFLLVALGVTFPVYLNLYAGIRSVDQRLVEAGRVFGMSQFTIIRRVILPGALAQWLVGLRYALGVAWIVLVASEQINSTSGLGYMMTNAQNLLETNVILVGILMFCLLGLASDVLVRGLERWALRWRRGLDVG
jgi:sulfonate transport system permease protein